MKLAVGFAVLFATSTQGFATAEEVSSAPNLAFIKLPGFQGDQPKAAPFRFQDLTLPSAFIFQGSTPIPMEWWEQGSNSPLAVVIGNAEGTRQLDGSMNPAYYWHRDPGNGANNFGSFSFQHLSHQETAGVLDQANNDSRRLAAAEKALPDIADQRQLVKLRRFHDLLQAQAKGHGMELTTLELINGLDLATQSELAGLDAWGYVDRLAQMKETVSDPDEQIIRARTWSYWDPVENRWAAPGLGNTEYYIRRDQARRFNAVKQALLYQEQQPSMLQEIDLAWAENASRNATRNIIDAEDGWAIALLNQSSPLEGSSFNRQPLQLELGRSGLENLLAETVAEEVILADAIAANATVAITTTEDIGLNDVDFKGELNRAKNQASPQISDSDAIEVALGLDRPLALETESEPAWERLAMTPEEFALATSIANPSVASEPSVSLATATEALETEAIAMALEASVIATSVETASALASANSPKSPQPEANAVAASTEDIADSEPAREESVSPVDAEESISAVESSDLEVIGNINSSLLTVQPFIPQELQALPLEMAVETEPTTAAVKPGQPFQHTPEIVQLAAMAHVQAAEPLISDRIESQEFLDLASGLKESPIEVLDESLGLAVASEATASKRSQTVETEAPVSDDAVLPAATIHFAPQATPLDPEEDPWVTPEAALELEAPPLEPIIPPDVQAMLDQQPEIVEVEANISETVMFFEENLSL